MPLVAPSRGGFVLPVVSEVPVVPVEPVLPLLPAAVEPPLALVALVSPAPSALPGFVSLFCFWALVRVSRVPAVAAVELPVLCSPACAPLDPLCLPTVLVAALGSFVACSVMLPDCACATDPLNIAAATDAPNKPFKSLFVFMSFTQYL